MNNIRINIIIDNKKISVEKGTSLLKAALDNGIEIPNLCYHRKLSSTGACRLCITKIEGQKGFVPACTVSVTEEINVIAFDSELEKERKHNLELLMLEYNYDESNATVNEFKILASKYGVKKQIDTTPSLNIKKRILDSSSPVLTYDSSKCIKCFRCIKACSEVQCKNVLSMSDRGIDTYVLAGTGKWADSECDGCGECVQLCPTDALTEKQFKDEINITDLEQKIRTTCPYCGVGCQIELLIKNNKILRVNGVESAMPNDGRLCVKGRFGYEYISSPKRLTKPLIKKNGKFVEAEWEEAISYVAMKFNEIKLKYGSNSLAGYASARCTNEDNYLFQKFIRIAFGTNNIDYCTRLCHASTVTAMIKSIGDGAGSGSIQDFETTDCLFVIGNNPIETHPVSATYIKRGKLKGNKIIIADPKWTPLVKHADIWLQHKIGTDVALLNGLIHVIIKENLIDYKFIETKIDNGLNAFEELKKLVEKYTPEYVEEITNVPAKKLIAAAKIYASSKNAIIATGMGTSQQTAGTNACFTLLNMMLASGQIGREGAGICPPRGQNNVQGATDVGCSPIFYPGYIPVINEENRKKIATLWNVGLDRLPKETGLTTIEIIDAAYEEKVKALYIMGENPMHTDPDLNHTAEAMKKMEFIVVQDIFPTLTTEFADVILPAAALAEKDGTVVSSDRRVLKINKAVEPPGSALPDWQIILNIAEKMSCNIGKYNSTKEIFEEIAIAAPIFGGVSHSRLDSEEIQWPCPSLDHPGTPTLYLNGFNTPSGKAKLHPVEYIEPTEKTSTQYPFILNSGRILYHYHSSTMSAKCESLNLYEPSSYVIINSHDAKILNIMDHESVKIVSEQGELVTTARVLDKVANGEIFMPWHWETALVNKLTRHVKDPLSKIAPFKQTACAVLKLINDKT